METIEQIILNQGFVAAVNRIYWPPKSKAFKKEFKVDMDALTELFEADQNDFWIDKIK